MLVELQQRLSTGADHQWPGAARRRRAHGRHRLRQSWSRGKSSAPRTICANKFGVAEAADGCGTILFASRPEIAAGKPTKDGWTSCIRTFALEGVKYLFDDVAHAGTCALNRLANSDPGVSRPHTRADEHISCCGISQPGVCTNPQTGPRSNFPLTGPTVWEKERRATVILPKDLTPQAWRQNDFSKGIHEMEDQAWLRPHRCRLFRCFLKMMC